MFDEATLRRWLVLGTVLTALLLVGETASAGVCFNLNGNLFCL